MSSPNPLLSDNLASARVRFDNQLTGDAIHTDQNTNHSAFKEILTSHVISTPINHLGSKLIDAARADNSPLFEDFKQLDEVVQRYSSQLNELRSELTEKQCGWHQARNDPSWSQNNKGANFDAMRCDIKAAMSKFSAALTEKITGLPGQYKDFGTQGYKSDIDLSYIPAQNNREFSYTASKLVFDAVFTATFNRLPEDLFDLEVYVQHPGKSMHTGQELKTHDGQKCFLQAEIQAAVLKIGEGPTAHELQNAICDGASESVQSGIKAIMSDAEKLHLSIQELKDTVLEAYQIDTSEKGGIYSPSALERGFAEASFRDTLIYNIYQDHIQKYQDQIQNLEKAIDIMERASEDSTPFLRNNSMQSNSFSQEDFNSIYSQDAVNSKNTPLTLEKKSSKASLERAGSKSSLESTLIRSRSGSLSSTSSHRWLEHGHSRLVSQVSRFFPQLSRSDTGYSSLESDSELEVASRVNSQSKDSRILPSFSISGHEPLTLRRLHTGASLNRPETPASNQINDLRQQRDKLLIKQAQYATYTESLTKEGFNTQGALRDIVENRDGQEDTKHAKQINEKIFNLELQDRSFPTKIQELLKETETSPDFYQKISKSKASSSSSSLLASAVENFHFYAKHLNESIGTGASDQKSADAVIEQSKYELRFATRALDLYKELQDAHLEDFSSEIEELEDLLAHADDLEKMKRQEQIPITAFEAKLAKCDFLFNSTDETRDFAQQITADLPKFKTPRLADMLLESNKEGEIPKIKSDAVTNVGYYKDVISRLSGEKGPFQIETLVAGSIKLPILKLPSNVPPSLENLNKVRELNTWAMALSGFPSSLYALPELNESEVKNLKGKNINTIMDSISIKGQDCKKKVFDEARLDILKYRSLETHLDAKRFFSEITEIYGRLVQNVSKQLGLFEDSSTFQDENSLNKPFLEIMQKLLTA